MSDTRIALGWCLRHFKSADEANAAVHCAPVKYSPITFAVAQCVHDLIESEVVPSFDFEAADMAGVVLSHRDLYELDSGR